MAVDNGSCVKAADLFFQSCQLFIVHEPGRKFSQLSVADEENAVLRYKDEQRIFCMGRLCIAELHGETAQVQCPVSFQFLIRRYYLKGDSPCVFSDNGGVAVEEFSAVSGILFHLLFDLPQMPVCLRAGQGTAMHGMHAESMIPVPVRDHSQIREGQSFPFQGLVKLLYMGGGMSRVDGDRHFFTANIAKVGPVFGGVQRKDPGVSANLLQMVFSCHFDTSFSISFDVYSLLFFYCLCRYLSNA